MVYNLLMDCKQFVNISYFTITEPTLLGGNVILPKGDVCEFITGNAGDSVTLKIVPYK